MTTFSFPSGFLSHWERTIFTENDGAKVARIQPNRRRDQFNKKLRQQGAFVDIRSIQSVGRKSNDKGGLSNAFETMRTVGLTPLTNPCSRSPLNLPKDVNMTEKEKGRGVGNETTK